MPKIKHKISKTEIRLQLRNYNLQVSKDAVNSIYNILNTGAGKAYPKKAKIEMINKIVEIVQARRAKRVSQSDVNLFANIFSEMNKWTLIKGYCYKCHGDRYIKQGKCAVCGSIKIKTE